MNTSSRLTGFGAITIVTLIMGLSVYVVAPGIARAETAPSSNVQTQIAQLLELVKVLQAQIAFLMSGGEAGEAGGGQGGISIGATVETSEKLKVRSSAGTSGTVLTSVPPLSRGTVIGGPQTASGFTWWQVAYQSVTGWSAANWLRFVSAAPTPTPLPTPLPTPIPTPVPTPTPTPTPIPNPTGAAFFDDFSGALDTSKYTASHGRMDTMTTSFPSTVAISGGRLQVRAGMQNYGDSAVRINQPFDFANRTGTFSFDVNTNEQLGGWTQVTLSENPYPYVSFMEFNTNGPIVQDGFLLQFRGSQGCVHFILYRDGSEVQNNRECGDFGVTTGANILNNVVVNVSNSLVTVTTDGHVVRFPTSLGFTRGYLYLNAHNHASMKYQNTPTWDTQWDNVRFDGPIVSLTRVALSPFNLPANPSNPRLVLQAQHDLQNTNVSLAYRLNGNAAHPIQLVRRAGQVGVYLLSEPVNVNELRSGNNTVTFEQTGMTNPLFTNVQLVWDGAAGTTPPPTPTPTPTPTVSLSASPTSITAGQSATLSWSSSNATCCTGTGFTASGVSGSVSVSPSSNAAYSITCTGAGGSASANANISVSTVAVTPPVTPPTAGPGLAFSEDFSTANAFYDRFDRGWSGGWNNVFQYGADINDWPADHDMSCGNPNMTQRTIHHTSIDNLKDAAFYHCLPNNNPAAGHLMSTVNTHGYVVAWFTPKQVFRNVNKVCWDQNLNNNGEGKWISVYFLTPSEYVGQTDLGFSTPSFPTVPRGPLRFGVQAFRGTMIFHDDGVNRGDLRGDMVNDKAPRFQHCVTDNENGTVTMSMAQQGGNVITRTLTGRIPDGDVRVVFGDDSYDPDKHFDNAHAYETNTIGVYTWHWDNVQIFTR